MRKSLTNIVFLSLFAASLLLPFGCSRENKDDENYKKGFDAITGEEDSYNKALRAMNNPRSIITGEAISKEKKLGDYFFKGKELTGLKVAPKNDWGFKENPHFLTSKELASIDDRDIREGLEKVAVINYVLPSNTDQKKDGKVSQVIMKFETEKNLWSYVIHESDYGERRTFFGEHVLGFIKGNFLSTINQHDTDLNTDRQEYIFRKLLISYCNRIDVDEVFADGEGELTKKKFIELVNLSLKDIPSYPN